MTVIIPIQGLADYLQLSGQQGPHYVIAAAWSNQVADQHTALLANPMCPVFCLHTRSQCYSTSQRHISQGYSPTMQRKWDKKECIVCYQAQTPST
jgi:hypothetical protein